VSPLSDHRNSRNPVPSTPLTSIIHRRTRSQRPWPRSGPSFKCRRNRRQMRQDFARHLQRVECRSPTPEEESSAAKGASGSAEGHGQGGQSHAQGRDRWNGKEHGRHQTLACTPSSEVILRVGPNPADYRQCEDEGLSLQTVMSARTSPSDLPSRKSEPSARVPSTPHCPETV